jgi:hypothetical protein
MTRDDIIRMAQEVAGVSYAAGIAGVKIGMSEEHLERFANLVAAAEREECAKLADDKLMDTLALMSFPPKSSAAWSIAAAIRERGKP